MLDIDASAALLDAMANASRLTMLCLLCENELSVSELCEAVNLEQSAVSQHLRRFRITGLVKTRRDAQRIFYRCDSQAVRRMIKTLEEIVIPGFARAEARS